jgi:hypothetical protein
MKNILLTTGAALAVGFVGLVAPASAAPIDVTGILIWAADTPTTAYTAPNETSNFSFLVDSILPNTTPSALTNISNFTYSLNGAPLAAVATATFFSASAQGMFDLNLSGSAGTGVVSIYGTNVGNIGTSWLIGPNGTYQVTAAISQLSPTGQGTVTLSAVPLPGGLLLFGSALLGAGSFAARRRAKTAA